MQNNDTYSSSSAEVYHKYLKLDPQDRYHNINPQHSFEQTTPDEAEYVRQSNEYNKIHFATKTARCDPNYDTMNAIPSVRIGDDDGEYSHLGDSEARRSNIKDYSHVTFQVQDEAKGNTDEDYSRLQCAVNKQIKILSDVAEYSHLDEK